MPEKQCIQKSGDIRRPVRLEYYKWLSITRAKT